MAGVDASDVQMGKPMMHRHHHPMARPQQTQNADKPDSVNQSPDLQDESNSDNQEQNPLQQMIQQLMMQVQQDVAQMQSDSSSGDQQAQQQDEQKLGTDFAELAALLGGGQSGGGSSPVSNGPMSSGGGGVPASGGGGSIPSSGSGSGSSGPSSSGGGSAPSSTTPSTSSSGPVDTTQETGGGGDKVKAMQDKADSLLGKPYVFGGGHSGWGPSSGYDCSGFVSHVLHAGGYLSSPTDTTALPSQAGMEKGPGQHVTVYDRTQPGEDGHVIMQINGQFYESGGSKGAWGGGGGVEKIGRPSDSYLKSFDTVLHPKGL